jgi:prepilin-type N-terminal cleavage/methylation domain-containing protein
MSMFKRCFQNKGMSLIEIVTVVAILGICIGFFYVVFFLNWQAFDSSIARADFGQELNQMVDGITQDGRQAVQINVVATSTAKTATFLDTTGAVSAVYTINSAGEFIVNHGAGDEIITKNIDFNNSNFSNGGSSNYIEANLTLTDNILGLPLTERSSVEVYTRTTI